MTEIVSNFWLMHQYGGAETKWKTLEHNGVLFPPEYVKHNIPIVYLGEAIVLNEKAEEMATLYAKYIDTDYIKNSIFRKNFWKGWKTQLGSTPIKKLEDVDFRQINDYILENKGANKKVDDEKYKWAIVDGKKQPVGNFRVEPPGIFMGRGCNPKLGTIKRRIYPEDIIINIGTKTNIPEPLPGHKWKSVVHDNTVEWLAAWKDNITNKVKYVWLGAHSDMKAQSDMRKFDLARKLKRQIKDIREANNDALNSADPHTKQVATALYFIDNFALRVGNEKGEDEADTVGVTSLRPEHIKFLGGDKIELDFLGKDSVRYNRKLEVNPKVYQNLIDFTSDKDKSDQLFDLVTSADVNKYLQGFMKDLTAKVFRTFNASYLFQKELKKISKQFDSYDQADKINLMLDEFNKANAKVALLCNHQKNITKSSNEQIVKLNASIKETKQKIKDSKDNKKKVDKLKSTLKKLKSKKSLKIEMKNISLGTSKINYIDPRISVAFIKRHNFPIDKIFTKNLQEKFRWAVEIDEKFVF